MYVFIDESGDSGFKEGSSPFLIFSFICFRSTNEIEQVSRILDEFKQRNGFSKHWEFKFNKTSKRYILKMAQILASRDFCIKFFVINKLLIPNGLNYSYEDFLSFALRTFPEKDLFLYIDGNAIRKVKKRISPKLRNAASVKRIKFVDSKKK